MNTNNATTAGRTAPVITAHDKYGRQETGRFVEVTVRQRGRVYVRLFDVTGTGPVVVMSPAEFAALGPIWTGHKGLNIGDRVQITRRTAEGAVDADMGHGIVESVMIHRSHGFGLMIKTDNATLSSWFPLGAGTAGKWLDIQAA